jgi:hypothetical protein
MFQFPVVALHVSNGALVFGPKELASAAGERPSVDDLVIDVRQLSEGELNMAGFLCGSGHGDPWKGPHVYSVTDNLTMPLVVAAAKFFEKPA